jgi:hypothetical protein
LLLALDSENCLRPPRLPRLCHHGQYPQLCGQSADVATNNQTPSKLAECPTSDEIKYRMTRIAMDALDIYLIEASTAIHVLVSIFATNFLRILMLEAGKAIISSEV